MNIGVVLAAGDSQRFGGYMHKQYLKLNGKEVVSYGIREMQKNQKRYRLYRGKLQMR